MRSHNGMRPQDIAILMKIISKGDEPWQNKDLAQDLYLSQSEISESLYRSRLAGLINENRKKVHRQSLMEFVQHGLHYVFPVEPGGLSTGVLTAHSHPIMSEMFTSELQYVWPDAQGSRTGFSIQPLYKDVVKAVQKDETLYAMLALTDVLRIGRTREINHALPILKKMILHDQSYQYR